MSMINDITDKSEWVSKEYIVAKWRKKVLDKENFPEKERCSILWVCVIAIEWGI
jgi:hypothetical protein